MKKGNDYGNIGIINTVALGICTLASTFLAIKAWRGANVFNTAMAIAGAAMCTVASAVFLGASIAMGVKTAKEYSCGNKGQEIASALKELNEPLAQHDNVVANQNNQPSETPPVEPPVQPVPPTNGEGGENS